LHEKIARCGDLKLAGNNRGARRLGLVSSAQDGLHAQLEKQVRRHLAKRWSQPLHRPTVEVFERLQDSGVLEGNRPVIFDSGCGTGASTQTLADRHPQYLVIGVDRSAVRLHKSGLHSGLLVDGNHVLARGELATFWRLAFDAGLKPVRHLLLYPNPWPKSRHLARRWHAHPVFPWLLALGGEIELRCNWKIYALEFAEAVKIATGAEINVERIQPGQGTSPFETKYLERGHALYSVVVPGPITAAFRLPW
jgi:tRNA G46 methylase TrmB